jgi:hypothetical protein
MVVTRKSIFSGIIRSVDMPTVTEDKIERWMNGELIHIVFPELSDDEREFIMSGVTKEEWDAEFKED